MTPGARAWVRDRFETGPAVVVQTIYAEAVKSYPRPDWNPDRAETGVGYRLVTEE